MKLAVIGSRSFRDYSLLKEKLDQINAETPIKKIISGGAVGADKLGEFYAEENNLKTKIFIPDWKKYGRGAGIIRNEDIIKNSDKVIAFWDGKSKGTLSSIKLAEKYNKSLIIVKYK
jgi:hypothetical protein